MSLKNLNPALPWQHDPTKTSKSNAPLYPLGSPRQATNPKGTGEILYPNSTTAFAECSAMKTANASLNPDHGTMLLISSPPHHLLSTARYTLCPVHINLPKTNS